MAFGERGTVSGGTPFEVRCFLRHRGSDDLHVASLEPLVPPEVKADSTPSFVVNGKKLTGNHGIDNFAEVIDAAAP